MHFHIMWQMMDTCSLQDMAIANFLPNTDKFHMGKMEYRMQWFNPDIQAHLVPADKFTIMVFGSMVQRWQKSRLVSIATTPLHIHRNYLSVEGVCRIHCITVMIGSYSFRKHYIKQGNTCI